MTVRLSAPAALLLCGEYYVTESGGAGLCLAIKPRAFCNIEFYADKQPVRCGESKTKLITMFAGNKILYDIAEENTLYAVVAQTFKKYLPQYKNNRETKSLPCERSCAITIDTNAFYGGPNHNKIGLGSSETAAVLLCAAVAVIYGKDPLFDKNVLAAHAARAHYVWQGERGSGYGSFAAVFGGIGIYYNNREQTSPREFKHNAWRAVPNAIHSSARWYFLRGGKSVSSAHAIEQYARWKENNLRGARKFHAAYNSFFRTVRAVLCEHNPSTSTRYYEKQLQKLIHTSKKIGIAIGKKTGVSAKFARAHNTPRCLICKAVGAGNECAVGIAPSSVSAMNDGPYCTPLVFSEGIRYEC